MARKTDVLVGNSVHYDLSDKQVVDLLHAETVITRLVPAPEPIEGDDVTIFVRETCWVGKLMKVTPSTYVINNQYPTGNKDKSVCIRATRPWDVRFYRYGVITLR